jgi:ABC-type lipoprotein release transport system permease subunit
MLLKLAWRNIWRNRRRTAITVASILFAVFFSIFMEAIQKGAWDNLISNVVNFYYGYVQVHEKGYWDDQNLDKAFTYDGELTRIIAEEPGVRNVLPRIESFALASTGNNTTGVLVVGIEPEQEKSMTKLHERIVEGDYLTGKDQAAVIAKGVAERLSLGIQDTLILISQGYHGVNAAGKYPVKGIVEFGSPELNKQMVYLPLLEAQWFYGAEGLVTSLALELDSPNKIDPVINSLSTKLDTSLYEVMDWEAMLPDLVEAKQLDSGGNIIVYFILYMIIGFGIFGTILMMTKERSYEMGVLISIGMRRFQLGSIIWLEVMILGLLGAILGMLLSVPLVAYFHVNPLEFAGDYSATMEQFGFEAVFPAAFRWPIFASQALIVIIITFILGLYPMWKIRKLEPVKAMRE